MGVLSGDLGGGEQDFAQGDNLKGDAEVTSPPEGKVETDVPDVYADGEKEGHPVFDVSPEEFFNNMKLDRKRLRFRAETPAQLYQKHTRFRRPFFIRNSDDGYLRKVK